MTQEGITQIDIKQVLQQKAPSAARKIPGFVVDYLIRTVHQDELNDILRRYHDKDGVAFMQELIGYFDLNLELVNEENIPAGGRYIFASNHPLGGLDGICLSAVIGGHFDGKIRYLVNDLLLYLSNLRSIFVPINKHGAQGKKNAELIEKAYASDNFPRRLLLTQATREDTGHRMEEVVHPKGRRIPAGRRTGVFRRTQLELFLPSRQSAESIGHKDEL